MKHNYPRAKTFPGPGFSAVLPVQGHDAARRLRAQSIRRLHAAMHVNEGLVLQMADDLRHAYDVSKMTVGLLGMAFKAEIDDTRAR